MLQTLRRWLGPRSEPSENTMESLPKTTPLHNEPAVPPVSTEASVLLPEISEPIISAGGDQTDPGDLNNQDMYGGTRPLPPVQTFQSGPGRHLVYAVNSDTGRVRSNNQDAVFTFFSSHISAEERPDFGLFAVADGMGGHVEGEKASAIATRVVATRIIEALYLNTILGPKDIERPIIAEVLSEAILKANETINEQIPEGGTTLTVAVIMGDMAYIGHVGDSRAYLFSGDTLEQVTRDHSLVQRLIELDQLTPEEAAHHHQKNVLYRAIGQSEMLEVDSSTRRLPPNSRLLICSDGLWGLVGNPMLQEIIRSAKSPQDAVDRMIKAANERGGPDNITALLVHLPG